MIRTFTVQIYGLFLKPARFYVEKFLFFSERHLLGLEEERPAVEVAADEVAEDLADVDDEDIGLQELVGWRDKEIEGIGDGVGEAAENEDGHTKD